MAIRRGEWKLVRHTPAADPGFIGTQIAGDALTPPRLYNLAQDISESRDVAAERPELVQELQAAWDQWNA